MMTEKSGHKRHRGLMAIAALKFVNGFGLLALGFGALHFLNGDLPKEFARWMEYLTIVTTASLMPLELYEIYIHASWPRVVVLLVNIAVVAYLIVELRRTKKHKEG